ncbi:MAG: ABC transporter permease [Thermoleophilia bacterium]
MLLALLAGALAPYDPGAPAGEPLEAPGLSHPLGTNSVGQDLLSQLLLGARTSLFVAVFAGVGTVLIGATVGLLAGWRGGWVDGVLMRVVDVVLVIPKLPLLIAVAAYAGAQLWAIALIIALTMWAPSARVLRSQVLSLRSRTHLRAAVSFGARTPHVLRRHVVPELAPLLASGLVAACGHAVAIEAGLAFLGLGDPSRASWGATMRDALDFPGLAYTTAWTWWLVPPVAAICLVLLGLTFLGIRIERWTNPRLARHPGGSAS